MGEREDIGMANARGPEGVWEGSMGIPEVHLEAECNLPDGHRLRRDLDVDMGCGINRENPKSGEKKLRKESIW